MVNAADLPQEIVQPLLRLGRALMAHARAHRDTGLAEHEDGVLAAWRVVAPVLLEGVLQVTTTGLEDSARPIAARCPGCQQRRSVQSRRGRHVQTRMGTIRLKRWWHHCWDSQPMAIKAFSGLTSLVGGGSHMLGQKSDGTAWAWGLNDSGQLGQCARSAGRAPCRLDKNTAHHLGRYRVALGCIRWRFAVRFCNSAVAPLAPD
jgi:hypothetical protein